MLNQQYDYATQLTPYLQQAQQLYSIAGGKQPTSDQLISQAMEFQKMSAGGGLSQQQSNSYAKMRNALTIINELDTLFQKTKPAKTGFGGVVSAPFKELAGNLGDKNIIAYRDLSAGYLAPIIKALGEAGSLSDGDVIRALKTMPKLSDSAETAKIKLDMTRRVLTSGMNAIRQTGQMSPQAYFTGGTL